MINRINLILKAKNITARQFAEEIGIQPSGMSHILGGRNNPSLDFVTKVIRRYPEIDANWLLLGRGEMYTGATPAVMPPVAEQPQENTLFPELEEETPVDTPVVDTPVGKVGEPSEYTPTYIAVPPVDQQKTAARHLERLLFIYSDGTFEECLPVRP